MTEKEVLDKLNKIAWRDQEGYIECYEANKILHIIHTKEKEINKIKSQDNIPKNKIREKIEELKKMENDKNFHFYVNSEDIKRTIITNLEELLDEEE